MREKLDGWKYYWGKRQGGETGGPLLGTGEPGVASLVRPTDARVG
jgi:hypothetical protein